MIEEINIRNFQSHEDTRLALCSGVNVIVGESDCGKSSIIRAIRWVLENRPLGDAFRSRWGGETDVEIVLEGSPAVSRVKSKQRNSYFVGDRELEAVRAEVPEEVRALLNMPDNALSLQRDSFYMVNANPGERARRFNDAAGLDSIHRAMKEINAFIREEQDEKRRAEEAAEAFKAQETALDWVAQAEVRLSDLEAVERIVERSRGMIAGIRECLAGLATVERDRDGLAWVVDADGRVNFFVALAETLRVDKEQTGVLRGLLAALDDIGQEKVPLAALAGARAAIDDVLAGVGQMQALAGRASALRSLVIEAENQDGDYMALADELAGMQLELDKAIGQECPLCGRRG
jgi:DNA repair exonuclease SbcCD ATPase subunit